MSPRLLDFQMKHAGADGSAGERGDGVDDSLV